MLHLIKKWIGDILIYFLSILNGEYIKIGYTGQEIEKRKTALQTGNPHEIEILFTIDGSLKEEKEIHKSLSEVFSRLKVFSNPVNEWYSGENPIVKMFICNVRNQGIDYAITNLKSIIHWDLKVKDKEIFTIRHLEKSLHRNGLSRSQAKLFISERKRDFLYLLASEERLKMGLQEMENKSRVTILRRGTEWIRREPAMAIQGRP